MPIKLFFLYLANYDNIHGNSINLSKDLAVSFVQLIYIYFFARLYLNMPIEIAVSFE